MGPFQILLFVAWAVSAVALTILVLMHSGKGTGVSDIIASSLYNQLCHGRHGTEPRSPDGNYGHRFCRVCRPVYVLLPAGHRRLLSASRNNT